MGDVHVAVVATRNIKQGEELFTTYGVNYWINYNKTTQSDEKSKVDTSLNPKIITGTSVCVNKYQMIGDVVLKPDTVIDESPLMGKVSFQPVVKEPVKDSSWENFVREISVRSVPVKNTTDYAVAKDKFNVVKFEPVKTTAIKVEVQLPEKTSSGLHEWNVK